MPTRTSWVSDSTCQAMPSLAEKRPGGQFAWTVTAATEMARKTPRYSAAVLTAAVAAVYANGLGNQFVFDDRSLVVENPALTRPDGLRRIFDMWTEDALILEGYRLCDEQEWDRAIEIGRRVVEMSPAEGEPHYHLACYRALAGKRAEALDDLRRSIELGYANVLIQSDPDLDFLRGDPEFDALVTAIEDRIRQARMPDSSVRVGLGVLGADGKRVSQEYLPAIPVMGASWRLNWDDGRWLSVDLAGGAGNGSFDVGYQIPATLGTGSIGVGAGYATLPRLFQAGIGLRADTLVLGRAFDPTQGVDRLNEIPEIYPHPVMDLQAEIVEQCLSDAIWTTVGIGSVYAIHAPTRYENIEVAREGE